MIYIAFGDYSSIILGNVNGGLCIVHQYNVGLYCMVNEESYVLNCYWCLG